MANTQMLYGLHAITAVLDNEPERLLEVMVAKGRDDERMNALIKKVRNCGVSIQFVHRKTLDDKCKGERHQGICARAKPAKVLDEADLDRIVEQNDNVLLLVLDGVTDPHNLGACLRNADAAGAHAVISPKDKSASINPVVSKVAAGAAETMPFIQVTNLARTLKQLQDSGIWVVGTAGEAENVIYDCTLTGSIALVMGAEGKGMRRLTRETCDELIKLPMAGSVSSLNVSVASGICLFEIVRQKK